MPPLPFAASIMNDRLIQHWLKSRDGNLVDRLGKLEATDAIAREMYLAVLSRLPEQEEQEWITDYLAKNAERREGALGDLAWALLNSAEFRFNH